ncbi:Transcriptional regulator, GntR family [Burkholderia sp. 8Y]|uniref:FadR/GntR family transcriptional regulator n=1 Tax=Burkholderia sp. 8Y TaxID=2653133 RepID=UPI0012F2D7A4|nr:GntR family transcriptional regulator [Burkholderia sp. 8Y]VXC13243.1 Transcriptional regulator, GntR family [Burkholderia sp. 8Y]
MLSTGVGDKIVEDIRLRLNSGELVPGDKLPSERELAAQLGVSRNVVRESLRVLEASGVVTIKKGHTGGAFISNGGLSANVSGLGDVLRIRGGQVSEIAEVRLWMGEIVVRAACERRTKANLENLREHLRLLAQTVDEGDLHSGLVVAAKFHIALAECSQNALLVLMTETVMGIASQFAADVGIEAADFSLRERQTIVDAIEEGAVTKAVAAMKAHLKDVDSRYRYAVAQRRQ